MRPVIASALSFAVLGISVSASAQQAGTAPTFGGSFGGSSDPVVDSPPASAPRDGFKPLALTLNPLSMLIGRLGANIEFLPAKHHALTLNPYYSSIEIEVPNAKTDLTYYGAELGYRYYSGSKGANGFFIGPAAVFTSSQAKRSCNLPGCVTPPEEQYSSYGVALDLGGQYVADSGFTIGGGAGLMLLRSTGGVEGSKTVQFEGVVPRILLTIGYSL